jgi:hypothetical protein
MHATAARPQLQDTTQVGIGPLPMAMVAALQLGRGSSRQRCGARVQPNYGLRHQFLAIARSTGGPRFIARLKLPRCSKRPHVMGCLGLNRAMAQEKGKLIRASAPCQ